MSKRLDWELSQNIEKEYWMRDKERVCSKWWLDVKKSRAERLIAWLSTWKLLSDETTILQIGAGAEGMINFIGVGQRFAIDPLAEFYKSEYNQILDHSVDFISGIGEELPYEDDMFDLVIMYNALDHTFSPQKVLAGIHRVLKPGGISYIAVHTYPAVWIPFLQLMKFFKGPTEHPWQYTSRGIKRELHSNSFSILSTKFGDKDESLIPDWSSPDIKLKIARLVGLNVPMFHVFTRKDAH